MIIAQGLIGCVRGLHRLLKYTQTHVKLANQRALQSHGVIIVDQTFPNPHELA